MEIITHNNILLRVSKSPKPIGDVWFISGYGESGLSFMEAFASPLSQNYNLFVPDLPGFGVSPPSIVANNQTTVAKAICQLIQDLSGNQDIYLVGHSQGGLVGTQLCHALHHQVRAYANIEGNLTRADITFSGIAAQKSSAKECKEHVLNFVKENARQEASYWRYHASLEFADDETLLAWAKNGIVLTGDETSGLEYAALPIPKIYLWGKKSCPDLTKNFLRHNALDNFCFKNSDHWPMIDEPVEFYKKVDEFFFSAAKAPSKSSDPQPQ